MRLKLLWFLSAAATEAATPKTGLMKEKRFDKGSRKKKLTFILIEYDQIEMATSFFKVP